MISVEQGQHIFFYFISDFFILPLLWDFIFSTLLHETLSGQLGRFNVLLDPWIHGGLRMQSNYFILSLCLWGPQGENFFFFNFYSSKRFWAPFNICDENQPFARSGGVENNEGQTCCYFLSFILFFTSYICTFP